MVGSADAEHVLFLARGADHLGAPSDVNEAERIAWVPLDEVRERIASGEIIGAGSQVGLLHVLAFHRSSAATRAPVRPRAWPPQVANRGMISGRREPAQHVTQVGDTRTE